MIDHAGHAVTRRLRSGVRRLAARIARPPLILMYHRVARTEIDPWRLCVSPENFAAQMAWVRTEREPMRLGELTRALAQGRSPRGALVVTFDDGYRDNLMQALPVLEAERVPATVFCTSGVVGSGQAFWWDRLAVLVLSPAQLPPWIELAVGAAQRRFDLGPATRYDAGERARDRHADDDGRGASPRLAFYREVWAWLRPLRADERDGAIAQIAAWSGASSAADDALPLSQTEARSLAASPWIEIGAHSVTHAALPGLPPPARREEVAHSKRHLEALIERPVTSFAYPFGDEDDATAAAVRDAGFDCSCTTRAAAVRRDTDRFHLPRIAVGDWDAATLARTLRDIA
jgi:peptidoglycan/xylan/chitin deacetylase (PgdA/CDA1 family)